MMFSSNSGLYLGLPGWLSGKESACNAGDVGWPLSQNMEDIKLSEIVQTEKDKSCVVSLVCRILKKKKKKDFQL